MKLLAIDTATEACSTALYVDGALAERFQRAPRKHGELVLPMVDELLAEAQLKLNALDGLAFGRGPGAFTGVRIAVSVVQGLALGADLGVVPVSDLAALAAGAMRERGCARVVACLDARMGQVYSGEYVSDTDECARLLGEERLSDPDKLDVPDDGTWWGVGPGWAAYPVLKAAGADRLQGLDTQRLPRARDIARLALPILTRGKALPPDQALPVYLRDTVAWKKAIS